MSIERRYQLKKAKYTNSVLWRFLGIHTLNYFEYSKISCGDDMRLNVTSMSSENQLSEKVQALMWYFDINS